MNEILINMSFYLGYEVPNPIRLNDLDFVLNKETVSATYKNRKLSCKRRFEFLCDCGLIAITSFNILRNKKYSFLCRSCSMKCSWQDEDYKAVHLPGITALGKSIESSDRARNQFKRMWENPASREEAIRRCHSEAARNKQSSTIKNRLLVDTDFAKELLARGKRNRWGEHHDYVKNDLKIHLKSRGELKVAKLLDYLNLKWSYEPKGFFLKETKRLYFPDFFIEENKVWIEVKYSRKQDLSKPIELKMQDKDINLALLDFKDIKKMESLCESLTSKNLLLNMLETLQLKTITTF